MTASPSRDFRAQGMKKDLYPHGSRELVDPKCEKTVQIKFTFREPSLRHDHAIDAWTPDSLVDFHTGVTDKPMTRKLRGSAN